MQAPDIDVLIVGAGLSGISAAYHIGKHCPSRTFAIIEAREQMGGTWDLFRYPGVRSDSDMYTLGYAFRPWTQPQAIAGGPAILSYIRETAAAFGIDRKIEYRQRLELAEWSSADACWTVSVRDLSTGLLKRTTCRFLYLCTGYYEYEAGYTPDFPGRDAFKGTVVHPQAWPAALDCAGKQVVVIGSGATAITLVPALATSAAHVTMLQRSPSYVLSLPSRDGLNAWLRRVLPASAAIQAIRWRNIVMGIAFYLFCRVRPEAAKRFIRKGVVRHLGDKPDWIPHFTPAYNPWDQRVCMVPDGDFFVALKERRAAVVTDHIEAFTATGIRLKSGRDLQADVIVTATGLKMRLNAGATIKIDGRAVDAAESVIFRGAMVSDVPNFAFTMGYTNASWTLKSDLIATFVCRILNYMDERHYQSCCPRFGASRAATAPIIDFSSGYVQRALATLPRQGRRAPWRLYQNYILDLLALKYGSVSKGLEFARVGRL